MKSRILKSIPLLAAAALVFSACDLPTSSIDALDEAAGAVDQLTGDIVPGLGSPSGSAAGFDAPEYASAELAAFLSDELDLTSDQQASLQTAIEPAESGSHIRTGDRYHVRSRGLWFLAARLEAFLTDHQEATLFRAASHYADQHPEKLVGVYETCRHTGSGGLRGTRDVPFSMILSLLTREQRAEVAELRAAYQERAEAIRRMVQSGEMTRREALHALATLNEALMDAILALLSEEQIAALRERISGSDQDGAGGLAVLRAAMIDALGLRERQVGALDLLHREQCGTFQTLQEAAQHGRITREEYYRGLERLAEAKKEAYASILTRSQFAIAEIHDALLVINARRFIRWVGEGSAG